MNDGLEWQTGIWNRMSGIYQQEIDKRFAPVVEGVIARAKLRVGESVLDLGTGTGRVAQLAAHGIGVAGTVTAVDISPEMLDVAGRRLAGEALGRIELLEGSAENIPAEDGSFDVVLASLSLMYSVDRSAATREIARVLIPGGRLVASTWGTPQECDLVLFQTVAGRFSGPPPVSGVGPGALGDPAPFLTQLADAGIVATFDTEIVDFGFADFDEAWEIFAGVTAAELSDEVRAEAQQAVIAAMDWHDRGPREFRNATHFITGRLDRPPG